MPRSYIDEIKNHIDESMNQLRCIISDERNNDFLKGILFPGNEDYIDIPEGIEDNTPHYGTENHYIGAHGVLLGTGIAKRKWNNYKEWLKLMKHLDKWYRYFYDNHGDKFYVGDITPPSEGDETQELIRVFGANTGNWNLDHGIDIGGKGQAKVIGKQTQYVFGIVTMNENLDTAQTRKSIYSFYPFADRKYEVDGDDRSLKTSLTQLENCGDNIDFGEGEEETEASSSATVSGRTGGEEETEASSSTTVSGRTGGEEETEANLEDTFNRLTREDIKNLSQSTNKEDKKLLFNLFLFVVGVEQDGLRSDIINNLNSFFETYPQCKPYIKDKYNEPEVYQKIGNYIFDNFFYPNFNYWSDVPYKEFFKSNDIVFIAEQGENCYKLMPYILSNYFEELIRTRFNIKIIREEELVEPLPKPPYILQRSGIAHFDVIDEDGHFNEMGRLGLCLFVSFLYVYKIENPAGRRDLQVTPDDRVTPGRILLPKTDFFNKSTARSDLQVTPGRSDLQVTPGRILLPKTDFFNKSTARRDLQVTPGDRVTPGRILLPKTDFFNKSTARGARGN